MCVASATRSPTRRVSSNLVKGGLAQDKERMEKELRAFVDGETERKAKYGTVLDDIGKEIDKNAAHREADAELRDEIHLPKLMWAAAVVVRMAEERAKPDSERDPEYQQRNWARHEQALDALTTRRWPPTGSSSLRSRAASTSTCATSSGSSMRSTRETTS